MSNDVVRGLSNDQAFENELGEQMLGLPGRFYRIEMFGLTS